MRRRRKTRRNLDEEEELREACQQRQKAPQDTVVHVPQLMTEARGGKGGADRAEEPGSTQGGKNDQIQAAGRKKQRTKIKQGVRKQKLKRTKSFLQPLR